MQTSLNRDRDFAVSKRSRGRSGCLNCRRRRKKCDEVKPACTKCKSRGESCEWDTRITFRLSGIETYDPSVALSRNTKASSNDDFQISNVTFSNHSSGQENVTAASENQLSRHASSTSSEPNVWITHSSYDARSNGQSRSPLSDGIVPLHPATVRSNPRRSEHASNSPNERSSDVRGSGQHAINLRRDSTHSRLSGFEVGDRPYTRMTQTSNDIIDMNLPSDLGSISGLNVDSMDHEMAQPHSIQSFPQLDVLDYLTELPNDTDLFSFLDSDMEAMFPHVKDWKAANEQTTGFPALQTRVDILPIETTCSPNTMNEQLQNKLYYHMVETVRHTALTRNPSPEPEMPQPSSDGLDTTPTPAHIEKALAKAGESSLRFQPLRSVKLTKRRHLELWRNYIDDVAVWLDMFDNDRNFQFQIPLLAKSADHLHYSILALSARQLERKQVGSTYTESIGLYQEAIQLIVKDLYTLDTSVIASCVLLCVLEMMSSSSGAWCRHLDGCAMLLKAAGINGVVGGIRQSLFWCFARMDVWGGFLEDTFTKIPTSRWFIPSGTMNEAVAHFKAGSGSHSYANYAVFLCASVVNVISNRSGATPEHNGTHTARVSTTFAARWRALYDLLDDWYNKRPEEMQPLMAYPPDADGSREPFSILLYGSSPAINGNQLYHAATLLMLQNKPKSVQLPKPSKSILWHARQICGIALSNSDHGALINSLQPIWIAGRLMSHSSEHRAILGLLEHIEKEIGWATAWRAEDLKEHWGVAEDSEGY